MQYFAQDEATRLDPTLTVYETLSAGSPHTMVPMIRNILGGFLFSGDDVYKKAGVLSGGERTRLAVARMLLRPSNTLLLDEPTNHLDIDSKEVLLDALADYGGTLVFVSHDRYFVEKLATKIIDVGDGKATLYPGTYEAFLWSKGEHSARGAQGAQSAKGAQGAKGAQNAKSAQRASTKATDATTTAAAPEQSYEDRKRESAEKKKRERALRALRDRVIEIEMRIADREQAIKDVEQKMAAPDFYNNHEKSKPILAQHQELMWEVGELLGQWEMLQSELSAHEN
jgi:ATP-binding cassette subfamily F protein 3